VGVALEVGVGVTVAAGDVGVALMLAVGVDVGVVLGTVRV
jgi:hypothetical protein